MNQPKLNISEVRAEQGASKAQQAIKLGLNVHAETIVFVRILDQASPQPAQKFTPVKFLEWVKKQVALADAVHSCYEAGPFGYGLHRQLVGLGILNVVVQPVCLDERHTGVNDDKRDARELALRLDRYVAGNAHALATGTTAAGSSTRGQPRTQPALDPEPSHQEQLVAGRALGTALSQTARLAGGTAGSFPHRAPDLERHAG